MPQLLVCETLKMVVFIELRIFLLLSVYLLWEKKSESCISERIVISRTERDSNIFHPSLHSQAGILSQWGTGGSDGVSLRATCPCDHAPVKSSSLFAELSRSTTRWLFLMTGITPQPCFSALIVLGKRQWLWAATITPHSSADTTGCVVVTMLQDNDIVGSIFRNLCRRLQPVCRPV